MTPHNLLQSIVLLGAMTALLALIGWVLAGPDGLVITASFGLFFIMFGRGASKSLMLKAIGARRISPADAPGLYAIAEEISNRAGLVHMPQIYLLDSEMMIGFSAGTSEDDAAIVLTGPLVQGLSAREIAGVLAHEASHIHAGDLVVMGIADLITRMTRTLSLLGLLLAILKVPMAAGGGDRVPWAAVVLLIGAPLVSFLLQMALSRAREYDADIGAVNISGDADAMASALYKLEQQNTSVVRSIFMPHRPGAEPPSLLRSHPVTEERVERIKAQRPQNPPLPDHLVGEHHGFPPTWNGDFTMPIRWLMRWWR